MMNYLAALSGSLCRFGWSEQASEPRHTDVKARPSAAAASRDLNPESAGIRAPARMRMTPERDRQTFQDIVAICEIVGQIQSFLSLADNRRFAGVCRAARAPAREWLAQHAALAGHLAAGDLLAARQLLGRGLLPITTVIAIPGKVVGSVLTAAVMDGDEAAVRGLLALGAPVSQRGPGGVVPLHDAVTQNSPVIVEMLLDAKADPAVRDDHSRTPFHYAAAFVGRRQKQAAGQVVGAQSLRALIRREGSHLVALLGMRDAQGGTAAEVARARLQPWRMAYARIENVPAEQRPMVVALMELVTLLTARPDDSGRVRSG